MAADSGREQITEDIVHALDTATGGHFDYGSTMRWRIWPPESYPSRVVLDEEEVFDVETEGLLGRRLAIRVVSWHSVAFGKSDEPAKAASQFSNCLGFFLHGDEEIGVHLFAQPLQIVGRAPQFIDHGAANLLQGSVVDGHVVHQRPLPSLVKIRPFACRTFVVWNCLLAFSLKRCCSNQHARPINLRMLLFLMAFSTQTQKHRENQRV